MDNNNNDITIIDFFNYLNQITNKFITQIEIKPIRIKKDTYITGFKRIGLTFIETHVKQIKEITVKTNEKQNVMEMVLKETPETEIWLDIELLNKTTIQQTLNELRNYFIKLKNFEIIQIQYKLKTQLDNIAIQEETIIYDNKRLACKETIAKRKLCSYFKSHFTHFGDNNNSNNNNSTTQQQQTTYTKNNIKLTDEELAEMP